MPSPEVSIIMPLHDAAAYVGEAIASFLSQSFRDFELLVIDDGSTDAGPDIVRSVRDERIRLISNGRNAGPAAARNRGLAGTRGRIVAFFDSDDIATPDMLSAGLESISAGYEIVSGWYEGIDEKGELTNQNSKPEIAPVKIAPVMLFRNIIATPGLLMKRECLDGQRFDETLAVASDYDMWAILIPRVQARYRSHLGNISHRKASLTGECLARVHTRQLARLGIAPCRDELELHARFDSFTFGTSIETVRAAEQWLLKLESANGATAVYPIEPFRETLGDYWYGVCHSAGVHGLTMLREYHDSPLAGWISPTARQQYDLLRLSARGAVKNLLARLEPPDAKLST
jgi:glycosyltransferase involved in cell wall biosynthesis